MLLARRVRQAKVLSVEQEKQDREAGQVPQVLLAKQVRRAKGLLAEQGIQEIGELLVQQVLQVRQVHGAHAGIKVRQA